MVTVGMLACQTHRGGEVEMSPLVSVTCSYLSPLVALKSYRGSGLLEQKPTSPAPYIQIPALLLGSFVTLTVLFCFVFFMDFFF